MAVAFPAAAHEILMGSHAGLRELSDISHETSNFADAAKPMPPTEAAGAKVRNSRPEDRESAD
jgi:hypothetical protein